MPYWVAAKRVGKISPHYHPIYRYHSTPDCPAIRGREVRKIVPAIVRMRHIKPCRYCCKEEVGDDMGRRSRDKGARREREFAALVGGERIPLSGAAGGSFREDVLLPNGWRAQVKARKDGWRTLYAALGDADILALKADRRPWLVVLPVERFMELLHKSAATGVRD